MTFWKPGTARPGAVDRAEEDESYIVYNSSANLTLAQQRARLPIYEARTHLLYLVEKFRTVVVVGETGCGKTTQLPQYLHEAGWTAGGRMVACTQPRRVAASSVAARVAEEMGVGLGDEVGYCMRFDDCTSERTRIKYLTDGMLMRETMQDPLLSAYSVIMLDEAHERSVSTDVLLGLLKKIQRKRKDLRVIVSSATVDARAFCSFFNTNSTGDKKRDTATIIRVEGRQYPVNVYYTLEPVRDYKRAAIETVLAIHTGSGAGDILVFLTGMAEIEEVVRELTERARSLPRSVSALRVLPLHANLHASEQNEVFDSAPRGTRKVIVSTNIAETSVTIDGVVYVVDCGFVKVRAFSARTGMEQLVVTPVSQAQANQRAGRAGRVQDGKCYRLYTADAFKALAINNVPEIQRQNLASVVMQLKALGIDDVVHFDFLSPPPPELLVRALDLLYSLGALNDAGKLTAGVGEHMAELPLDPKLSKMLLASGELGCAEEALTIAAVVSVQNLFSAPRSHRREADAAKRIFAVHEGDQLTYLNVYNGYIDAGRTSKWCHDNYVSFRNMRRAEDIRKHLRRHLKRIGVPLNSSDDPDVVRKCIAAGFFAHAAMLQPDGSYRNIRDGAKLAIHPSSILYNSSAQWVVYHQVVITSEHYMRDVCTIEPTWLAELAPNFYEYKRSEEYKVATGEKEVDVTDTIPPPAKQQRR